MLTFYLVRRTNMDADSHCIRRIHLLPTPYFLLPPFRKHSTAPAFSTLYLSFSFDKGPGLSHEMRAKKC